MQKFSCGTVVCIQFSNYEDYLNYKCDLIRWPKG
jgi:DNA-directed RNA polymerase subunit N (RpoN/RPB10)